jgi:hypothetical protein
MCSAFKLHQLLKNNIMRKESQTVKIETPQALHIADVGRSLFNHIRNRIDRLNEQMDDAKPFSQSYNNLSEREAHLLTTLKTLEKEGLL